MNIWSSWSFYSTQTAGTKMLVGGNEDEGLIYPCSKCDVIYRSASRLRKHAYDVHHDRELFCEICEVKVKTRKFNSFRMHRARCKEITKLEIFKCDQCDFTCQSQKRHLGFAKIANDVKAKHEGVLYSCDVCDHKTQYKSNMEQHREYKHRTKSIRVNCYCWGNSSMVEGRFSKWF